MKHLKLSKTLVPGMLFLAFVGPVALVIGCGGSDSTTYGGAGVQTQSLVLVQGVAPAGTPGGGGAVSAASLQMSPVETALTWISQPAHAQSSSVALANFLATAFDSRGQAVATVPCDAQGNARFDSLPPGIYRVLFFNTNFPTTFVQTIINVASGVPINARANETTSAAVMVLLNLAGGLDFSRLNALTIFNNAQTTNGFQDVVTRLRSLLVAGQPNFNQGNGGSLDPQLTTAVTTVAGAVNSGGSTGGTSTGGTSTGGTSTGGTSTGGTSTGGTSTGGTSTGGTSTGGTSTGGTSTGGTSTGGTSTGGTSTGGTSTGGTSTG